MGKPKEQFLTKRVLLSLCTAGVLALSVPNMANAADGDYQIWNDTPGTTESLSDGTVTQTGEPEAVNSGGGIIALTNYTINGQIWSGNHGEVNITGGTISSEKLPSSLLNEPLIRANQANISLSGVTVNASNIASDGNHILVESGGKIAIESSTVYADIASSGKGSEITVKDSAMFDAYAYGGGTITAENSSFDALIAGQYVANNQPQVVGSGSIRLTGGSVKDYIFATDGGTVETAGSTVNISNAAAFNGGTISIVGTADSKNVEVRGDESNPKDIQPSTLYAYNKGQIALKNVDLKMTGISATPPADMDKTFIHAEGVGSKITLENVKANITSKKTDHDAPEIFAEKGGHIELIKADFSSGSGDVAAKGSGSVVSITDSKAADLDAYEGGAITAKGSDVEAVHVKDTGSKIGITGGNVTDYIFATDGGTVETSGTAVNISNAVAFNGASISIAGTAEDAKANVTVKGSDDPKDIQPSTLYAYNKGQIALKNVDLTMTDITATPPADMDKTFIHAEGAGSKITLENVTAKITSTNANHDDPEIFAEKGGRIELINTHFDLSHPYAGDVAAKGNGSVVTITDSTVADLEAYEGGAITVKNSTVEAVKAGQHGAVKEYTQGTIDIIGGVITDYATAGGPGVVTITDAVLQGGEVESHNGGTIVLKGTTTMADPDGKAIPGLIGANDNGTVRIEGGTYGAKDADVWLVTQNGGKIQLQGGTLYTHGFDTHDVAMSMPMQNKSLVLSGSGNLVTTSGQVFEHGIDGANLPNVDDAKKWAANVTDAGAVYNQKIDFQGGKLSLDDAFYTLEYVTSAQQSLNAVSANKTALEMLSEGLVDAVTGEKITQVSVADMADGLHLTQVSGTTVSEANPNGQSLLLGSDLSDTTSLQKDASLGLKNLQLGDAKDVRINNSNTLTLYGDADGGELVQSTDANKQITVGEVSGTPGNLVLGGTGNPAQHQGQISGTVAVNNGTLSIANGSYSIKTLTAQSGSSITVGSDQYAGSLIVEKANLNGATLFLDPVWDGAMDISDASFASLIFDDGRDRNQIDGKLIVGRNSVLVLGSTEGNPYEKAEKAFTATGLRWGEDTTAALYVDAPQTFDTTQGSMTVDGSLSSPASAIPNHFANKSILLVNGANAALENGSAVFAVNPSQTAQFSIGEGSRLYIANTQLAVNDAAKTYQIFGDGIDTNGTFWKKDQIITNALTQATPDGTGGIELERQNASQVYSSIALANTLDKININTASSNAGEAYLSRFLEGKAYKDASVARNINAAAQLAQTVGITKTSIDATQSIADTVTQRLSLAAEPEEGRAHEFWVKYLHNDTDVDSLSLAGGLEAKYDSSYDGFILGLDFEANENRTSGAAFSYGSGDSSSAYASDDFDFWGLTYYNAVKKDGKNFIWDVGYSNTDHDVKGMELNASPDTDIFTIGMRGERVIQHSKSRIVPYVGLRYMNVDTGSYSGTQAGRIVLQYDAEKQNIWLLPIGVNFSREKTTKNGWTWRPSVDLSYVFNFGDHDDDMTVRVPGLSASDSFSYDVTDEGAFVAKVGLEGLRDNWSMGIGYTRQQGSDSHSDRFYANVSFKF